MKNFLIYQAHTLPILYQETIYSIYSYVVANGPDNVEFIIYTDDEAYLRKYLSHVIVTYKPLGLDRISEWKGDFNFIHRLKIKMLQDVSNHFEGNFLYVDSDTYFTKPLKEKFKAIEEGNLFMHCQEVPMGAARVYRTLLGKAVTVSSTHYQLIESTHVWNAGALGFTNTARKMLNDVLSFTDQLFPVSQKHVVEQLAFSVIFNQHAPIRSLEHEIFHYWYIKEFRQHLEVIFKAPLSHDKNYLEKIVKAISPQQFSASKLQWRSHSGFYRGIQRMLGKDFALDPLPDLQTLVERYT